MSSKKIVFELAENKNQIEEIYNFNVQAFADSHDFLWTEENLSKEIKEGWNLYSVKVEEDIICAIFMKTENNSLLTKNTPIKINYQGNGYSHIIKEFYEQYAKEQKANKVFNYCPIDNFRMISLNEGHNYEKTGESLGGNENMIEWVKDL